MTALLPALAGLCTTVFREWPHLHDGDGSYDPPHLQALADCPNAALIIAFDDDIPVGASTCLPLSAATANVRAPFLDSGLSPDRFVYLAESVLLPRYRGFGLGAQFFRMREAHARTLPSSEFTCFCTVQRSSDHPMRPPDSRPLDGFWRRQGYRPKPDLRCVMEWKEIGLPNEREMSMMFWIKRLAPKDTSRSESIRGF